MRIVISKTADELGSRAAEKTAELIKAALKNAVDQGLTLTDDCAAVERLGMRVRLVEGDPRNRKITRPEDLKKVKIAIMNGDGFYKEIDVVTKKISAKRRIKSGAESDKPKTSIQRTYSIKHLIAAKINAVV